MATSGVLPCWRWTAFKPDEPQDCMPCSTAGQGDPYQDVDGTCCHMSLLGQPGGRQTAQQTLPRVPASERGDQPLLSTASAVASPPPSDHNYATSDV